MGARRAGLLAVWRHRQTRKEKPAAAVSLHDFADAPPLRGDARGPSRSRNTARGSCVLGTKGRDPFAARTPRSTALTRARAIRGHIHAWLPTYRPASSRIASFLFPFAPHQPSALTHGAPQHLYP